MKLIPAAIVLVATITSFVVSGCEFFEGYKCPDDMDSWVKYELFMGRSGPNGDVVDDAEWTAFLDDVITPRFPDGLTVVDGYGQWRGESGEIQQEASKVIIIVAPRSDGRQFPDQRSFAGVQATIRTRIGVEGRKRCLRRLLDDSACRIGSRTREPTLPKT